MIFDVNLFHSRQDNTEWSVSISSKYWLLAPKTLDNGSLMWAWPGHLMTVACVIVPTLRCH